MLNAQGSGMPKLTKNFQHSSSIQAQIHDEGDDREAQAGLNRNDTVGNVYADQKVMNMIEYSKFANLTDVPALLDYITEVVLKSLLKKLFDQNKITNLSLII
jgi:hypothetical protein